MAWSDIASITISTSIWDRSGFINCDRLEPNGRRRSLFVHAVHAASVFHARQLLDPGAGDLPGPAADGGPRPCPGRRLRTHFRVDGWPATYPNRYRSPTVVRRPRHSSRRHFLLMPAGR